MRSLVGRVRNATFAIVVATVASIVFPVTPLFVSEAKSATISRVDVRGNKRIEAETVISYLSIEPGRSFSSVDIDDSLKSLFDTGLFSDVRITRSGRVLVVNVVENPIINRVSFEGNKKVKDDILGNIVQSKPRAVFTRARVQNDTQRILEAYRRNGRYASYVEPKIIEKPQNRVDLVFEIEEGDKTKVSRVNFIGNQAFSDGRLQDVIKTTESGLLDFLRTTNTYDPDRLNADEERLRQFYLNHGYADFRVVSKVAELDPERNVFFVTFTVDEGEKYTFGEIEIDSSLKDIDSETLRRYLKTRTGKTYSAELVDKTLEELTIEVSKFGYAFAQVRPRGQRDFENHQVNVTYFIDEGPRVYIERIDVSGNLRTRDYVIRREFDFAEGDAFNRVLLDRAKRRLNALGFFENVRVTTEPGSSPDRVILDVNVIEKSTGALSFGIGYSTSDGIIGDVTLTEKNFLGRGQFVKATVGGGQDRKNFEFSFTEPYFMGRRLSAGFDVYKYVSDQNDYASYDQELTGGAVRFGLPITENFSAQLKYSLYQQDVKIPERFKDCPIGQVATQSCLQNGEASLAIKSAEGDNLLSVISLALTYNTLDNPRRPRDGFLASLKQEVAGLGGDVKFYRATVDARAYHELVPSLGIVGMLRVRGGAVTSWGGKDVRIFDSFFKGGETLRGFKPSGIGPRDITPGGNNDALGGQIYAAGTAELQFPIFGLPPELGFSGALFFDAGTLYNVSDAAHVPGVIISDDNSIRSSVGFSLIWQSPFGPLRGDFAYALSKESYDKTQIFRFGGGTQF